MNNFLKKILFVSVASFLLMAPCIQAAKKYVPTPEQLQPSPANVVPNLSGNVNYIDTNPENFQEEAKNQDSSLPDSPKKPRQSFINNFILLPAQNSTAGKISRWLIILGLAGIGTWLVKKRYAR